MGIVTQFFIAGLTIEQNAIMQVHTYPANFQIPLTVVGESTAAITGSGLLCRTYRTDCCGNGDGETRQGEWLYPNGTQVRTSGSGDDFYRSRGTGVVILNRRNDATGPIGLYCCEVASVADPNATICINLSEIIMQLYNVICKVLFTTPITTRCS